jgi:hypothetical protein
MTAPEGKATSPEESEMHSSAARREVNATSVWKKSEKEELEKTNYRQHGLRSYL